MDAVEANQKALTSVLDSISYRARNGLSDLILSHKISRFVTADLLERGFKVEERLRSDSWYSKKYVETVIRW